MPLSTEWTAVARVDAQHYGPLYWDPDNVARRAPFTLVNLSVSVRTERWELRGYGTNVFNKRYDTLYDDNRFVGAPGGFDFANISRGVRYGIESTVRF